MVDAIGEVGCNKCTWLGCCITGSSPVLTTKVKWIKYGHSESKKL